MRVLLLALLLVTTACRIEKASSGRPPGQPNEADSLAAIEQDSASHVQVQSALETYYDRFARRDWRALRESFWPGAIVTTRMTPPGETRLRVFAQNVDEFLRRAPDLAGRNVVILERMVHVDIKSYGDMADAWVIHERRWGPSRDSLSTIRGVNAFHLYRHGGQWRIAGLTWTGEIPSRMLRL